MSAEAAEVVPGALPVTQVTYLTTYVDATGLQLTAAGGNTYTISLQLPLPENAFWSLGMYNTTSGKWLALTIF